MYRAKRGGPGPTRVAGSGVRTRVPGLKVLRRDLGLDKVPGQVPGLMSSPTTCLTGLTGQTHWTHWTHICANFLYEVQDGPPSGPYAPRPGRAHRPLRWRSATGSSLPGPVAGAHSRFQGAAHRRSRAVPPAGSQAPVRAGPSTIDQASRADQPAPPQTLIAPLTLAGLLRRHRPARSPEGGRRRTGLRQARWCQASVDQPRHGGRENL